MNNNVFAHRGYHDGNKNVPENSILSFKRAVKYGYAIELDVHLLKDDNVVVFHDYNLKRMCGVDKRIEECTYNELLRLNLLNTKEKIPLLSDALSIINGKVPVLIETKMIRYNGKLEEKVSKIIKSYKGKILVQSFNWKSILWFKKNMKNISRGILMLNAINNKTISISSMTIKTFIFDLVLKTNFISQSINSFPNKYLALKRKNKKIIAWTIKTKKDYEKGKKYCDYLICENMEKFY